VVNGSCIIDHIYTLLYVVHCNILTLKNLLTLYFLTTITKFRMVFISNRYLIFHYGFIILGHELKGVQLNGELKRVNVDPLVYLIILVILEKQFKMDIVKENFCFKLRFLFHISILSCFFILLSISFNIFTRLYIVVQIRRGGFISRCHGAIREDRFSLCPGFDDFSVLQL